MADAGLQKEAEFAGIFETHITVELGDRSIEGFEWVCSRMGLKPVYIQLPNGRYPDQPMTAHDSKGTLTSVKSDAMRLAEVLNNAGYKPIRVKIEAAPFNENIPQNRDEAAAYPDVMYFEYHAKALMSAEMQPQALEIARAHNAHLSANAFKIREDGLLEKFFTQRLYGIGLDEARVVAQALSDAIAATGTLVELKNVLEYCVFDTNSAIDEDWFDI